MREISANLGRDVRPCRCGHCDRSNRKFVTDQGVILSEVGRTTFKQQQLDGIVMGYGTSPDYFKIKVGEITTLWHERFWEPLYLNIGEMVRTIVENSKTGKILRGIENVPGRVYLVAFGESVQYMVRENLTGPLWRGMIMFSIGDRVKPKLPLTPCPGRTCMACAELTPDTIAEVVSVRDSGVILRYPSGNNHQWAARKWELANDSYNHALSLLNQ